MTNIGNEFGQVLNCVLTTGEGAGIDELCQGVVRRYMDAGEPEPEAIYVDNHCCNETGMNYEFQSMWSLIFVRNPPTDTYFTVTKRTTLTKICLRSNKEQCNPL